MKRIIFIMVWVLGALISVTGISAERLVILHTNDVHSNIHPSKTDGLGGALRRKVIIDSVRSSEPNVLLIDAGDAVQGTLYFVLYEGEVEAKLMNAMGYDIAILGNHDFDNGTERLARNVRNIDAEMLSSNYDFRGTELEGLFLPYSIRSYGDKKIAFIAINIAPDKLIDEENFEGVKYHDAITEANKLAHLLKTKEGADMVIALTHIGFKSKKKDVRNLDPNLAAQSVDIDLIIGGHSHTKLTPDSAGAVTPNRNGLPVTIAQTGSDGKYVGEIVIDTETGKIDSRLIPVDARWDAYPADTVLEAIIEPYRAAVDSVSSIKLGRSKGALVKADETLLNFASDMLLDRSRLMVPDVDFAIMNKGGIRQDIGQGDIKQGAVIEAFPFNNHLTVVELPGDSVMTLLTSLAKNGGAGISRGSEVVYNKDTREITKISINGKPLDQSHTYRIATIDYLAKGNDGFIKVPRTEWVARADNRLYDDIIPYVQGFKNKPIVPDTKARMHY